jgi:DNA-binding CsgD family transcriptional regulator
MTEAPSPFLPGTNIQFSELVDIACELILKANFNGECLECHLQPNARGYCYVSVGGRQGLKLRAHRLIYMTIHGLLDEGTMVLHRCDNRRCILDEHLYTGTALGNTADMIQKGRAKFVQPRQDHIWREEILKLHEQGLSRFEIAAKLFISPSTVWNYISPRGPYYAGK